MKTKAIGKILLTLLLASMLPLTFNATTVRAEGNPVVSAFHDRTRVYHASIFEDSITNVELNGFYTRSYYIRPQAGADVYNATVVMETPYSEEHFPWISWDPSADYTVTPLDGNFSYKWAYHDPIPPFGQATVWLHTEFPVTFKPEFDFQRNVDPTRIASPSVNQTVTIEFTPHMDFYNTHIQVRLENTSEATPTVVPGSASPEWIWFETPTEVNWQFNPNITTYTFSVQINVQNKLYPTPIFYKPFVWIGAFFNDSISLFPSTESVTVEDDLIKGSVTYSGTNSTGELYDWEVITQNENSVAFPSYSSTRARTNITIDKPYPQVYHYGETMHIKITLENPLPEPEDVILVWYAWLYPPGGTWIPLVATSYTVPADTVQTFDLDLPCNWGSSILAYWIVAILDPSTMDIISLDYVLWSYTPA